MTIEELGKTLGISTTTLKDQFPKTKVKLAEKGIIITKTGRGKTANYEIEYNNVFNDERAITIFEEERKTDIYLQEDMLRMVDWNLLLFIGVCLTPMLTFRGSYEDFLKYAGFIPSSANIQSLKKALEEMNNDYIGYYPDKTNENYFTASIYRQAEQDLKIPITKLRECKRIQNENHNRSFTPILKVWVATEEAIKNQPYTIQDLSDMTGLSPAAVRRVNNQLKDADIYITKKDYDPIFQCSKGLTATMNGFYSESKKNKE